MSRDEVTAGLSILAVFAVVLAGTELSEGWLLRDRFAQALSTMLGLLSGPSLVAALALGVYLRVKQSCKVRYCLRKAEHPVAGTCAKVCTRHHTRPVHERLSRRYARRGDELGYGETIDDA